MTPEHFSELAQQGFNRIPLVREILADLETPLSTYYKLGNEKYTYVLESVQGGEKWGRYSIIGLPSRTVLKVVGKLTTVEEDGEVIESHESKDPFPFIEEFKSRYKIAEPEKLPRFNGGLVGYFAYDTVRYVEHKVAESTPPDTIGTPDVLLMVSEEIVVFDNLQGIINLIVYADPAVDNAFEKAVAHLDELALKLKAAMPEIAEHEPREVKEEDFVSCFKQEDFEEAVLKIKDYINAGDVMQVVLSQRMSIPFTGDSLNVYRALRRLNPSPYMVYMDMGDFQIVSASPEILARLENGKITVRPLAGTRRRGKTEKEDLELEKELLDDPKEIAEHLMLIDLSRNDSGKVSRIGSVNVPKKMFVERYSHVMHIASTVESVILEDKSDLDVLKSTLPVGTLSGAPKVRAMEIIDEFESVKRGIYGGAMGYLSWNGNMDMAIAIRTAVVKDNTLYVQAGAGIVADSDPRSEWEETISKARALFYAVKLAEKGFS